MPTAATADAVAFTGFGHIAAIAADATAGATGGKGGKRKLSRALVAVKARCCTAERDARCGGYPAITKWGSATALLRNEIGKIIGEGSELGNHLLRVPATLHGLDQLVVEALVRQENRAL